MKSYKITLKSKDNNIFEYSCLSENFENAVKEAMKIIERNGWDHYQYNVYRIEEK